MLPYHEILKHLCKRYEISAADAAETVSGCPEFRRAKDIEDLDRMLTDLERLGEDNEAGKGKLHGE